MRIYRITELESDYRVLFKACEEEKIIVVDVDARGRFFSGNKTYLYLEGEAQV